MKRVCKLKQRACLALVGTGSLDFHLIRASRHLMSPHQLKSGSPSRIIDNPEYQRRRSHLKNTLLSTSKQTIRTFEHPILFPPISPREPRTALATIKMLDERELAIDPIVQDSVQHNARVSPSCSSSLFTSPANVTIRRSPTSAL